MILNNYIVMMEENPAQLARCFESTIDIINIKRELRADRNKKNCINKKTLTLV